MTYENESKAMVPAVDPTLVRASQPGLPQAGAPQQTPPALLGPYTLHALVGRGGMASVYSAHEVDTGRVVALKLMDPQLPNIDAAFVDRFLQEARSSAALSHPNIVEVRAYGEQSGWYFLATEYIEGGTLAGLLRQMGPLPSALASELLAQLLAGLVHCHEKGLIHRDLKPENLLLTREGVLKIADFGIARSADQTKLTKTGMMVGTAAYMSPEQARGRPIDARSDLFAVGIILYEMLAGTGPFHSENPATTIMRILSNEMTPVFDVCPTALGPLEDILERLLQPEPDARFASAQDALDAVLPLVVEHRRTRPGLVADALFRPADVKRALDVETASAFVAESRQEEGTDAFAMARTALKLHLAIRLDPGNEEARASFDALASKTTLNFGVPNNPRIAQLERQLADGQALPALFAQLAQLYRLEGNPLKTAGFLKRYQHLMPHDAYVANQLAQLVGDRKSVGRSGVPMGPQTRKLIAGIRTGGFRASQSAAPSQTSEVIPSGVELSPAEPYSALSHLARRWGPSLALVLIIGLGIRWGVRKVDQLTSESLASTQQLRNNVASASTDAPEVVPQLNFDKRVQTAMSEAARLDQSGSRAAAIQAYEQVMTDFPKRPQAEQAAFRRARLLSELGRHSGAQEAFADFIARWPASPNAPEALLRLGLSANANLRSAEAEAALNSFLERHASHPLVTEAFVARGELFARKSAFASAKADFEAALARLGPSPLRDRAAAGLKSVEEPR